MLISYTNFHPSVASSCNLRRVSVLLMSFYQIFWTSNLPSECYLLSISRNIFSWEVPCLQMRFQYIYRTYLATCQTHQCDWFYLYGHCLCRTCFYVNGNRASQLDTSSNSKLVSGCMRHFHAAFLSYKEMRKQFFFTSVLLSQLFATSFDVAEIR